jgi:hypothetical protein
MESACDAMLEGREAEAGAISGWMSYLKKLAQSRVLNRLTDTDQVITGTHTFLPTSPPTYTILISAPYVLFMLSSEMT